MIREIEIKKGPAKEADTLGILPANTIGVDQKGKTGQYRLISVELADGQSVDGWVPADAVVPVRKGRKLASDGNEEAEKKPKEKIYVPPEEALLLRRDPSFIYGAQAGANFAIIQTNISTGYSSGTGFIGGGYIGFFLDPQIPLRVEGNILQANGSLAYTSGAVSIGFNFFEIGIVPSYRITKEIEVFLGLNYQFGIGVGNIPTGITLNSASDLSSVGFTTGAGYRIKLGPEFYLALRLRYETNFVRSPFVFQNIGVLVAFEFEG